MKWNVRIAETAEREITALSLHLQKMTFDRLDSLVALPGNPHSLASESACCSWIS